MRNDHPDYVYIYMKKLKPTFKNRTVKFKNKENILQLTDLIGGNIHETIVGDWRADEIEAAKKIFKEKYHGLHKGI